MKKIKSIHQLQAEKRRIRQRREDMENRIRSNWCDLKKDLKPVNLAGEALSTVLKNKAAALPEGEHILKSTFTYGVSLLAQKLADKAGDSLETLFKKK
ncbi:MAG: hypothetical protein IPP72_15805 [Chitinophagaceae bacterium]|nr:hypothetical protein [Chitinophagaceae bacterium]